ncbi:MAG: cache domain-containing protein [Pontibacterium sp.]
MSIKSKILLLALLPLILMTVVITLVSQQQAHRLSGQGGKIFEENLLSSRRNELQNYVSLAMTSIAPVISQAEPGDLRAQKEVKRILRGLTYGTDGYFFVYDPEGVNLVHPIHPELVGQNLMAEQDRDGRYVIRDMLALARAGGGFYRYVWTKPSRGGLEEKLSYVINIPELNWMLGTGIYIDDIAREVKKAHNQVDKSIRETFITVLMLLSASVLVTIVAGIAINVHSTRLANKRLREVVHKYVQCQVNQQRNFARELHDGINQMMVSVKYRIELARNRLEQQPENAIENLDKAGVVLNQAIQEVRRVSHDLRPSLLDDMGLESALLGMMDDFSERTTIRIKTRVRLPLQPLPDDIEITLYRIVQEALANIECHSQASEVILKIGHRRNTIQIAIQDNGQGFMPERYAGHPGKGLANMRERAELLGGSFDIVSRPEQGTQISVCFIIESL